MKRFLLSIVVSGVLVIAYMVAASMIVVLSDYNMSLLYYIQLPLKLPQTVFYYFSPPTSEDFQINMSERKLLLTLIAIVVNTLLYAIPVYWLLGLIKKLRTPKSTITSPPPPPPSFN